MFKKNAIHLLVFLLAASTGLAIAVDQQVLLPMAAATNRYLALRVQDDAANRYELQADGKQKFGNGTDAVDVVLNRISAGVWGPSTGNLAQAGSEITSSAAELNILDGATATFGELNYLDIATLGTGAVSKAVVLDASGDYTFPATGTIVFPASSSLTMAASSTFAVATTAAFTGDVTGDGGDQLYGFLQDQVASTTVGVTAAQAGKTFVSNSADTMTLPEASTVLGARYTFVCGTADDFVINPADGTDVIGTVASITGSNTTTVLAPAAGDSITCTDIGSSITLEAVAADLWISVGNANGIWTDSN